jgi:AhpD family alkylhydroperoxidase
VEDVVSRIAKLPVDQWDPDLRALTAADEATPLEQGMMRMMAHTPEMAKGMIAFSGALFKNRTLPRRLVELVRLRVAFHNQCRSCMAIRYRSAVDDGMTEGMVCSLERPQEAEDLTPSEKAALRYAELSCVDHLSITEAAFEDLRAYFSEAQVVELGLFVAFFIGFGRLSAAWDMIEELPSAFQDKASPVVAPWGQEAILVRG